MSLLRLDDELKALLDAHADTTPSRHNPKRKGELLWSIRNRCWRSCTPSAKKSRRKSCFSPMLDNVIGDGDHGINLAAASPRSRRSAR